MVNAVLHLGAHRCATTSFQSYLETNLDRLRANDIDVWTPENTRSGLFGDLFAPAEFDGPEMQQSFDGIQKALGYLTCSQLLVSEENMIGSPLDNIDRELLYPDLQQRMSRFKTAFSGHLSQIGLSIRSYETYWASLLSFAVLRDQPMPDARQLGAISSQSRRWSNLLSELRSLFPTTPIHVWRFEDFARKPNRVLPCLLGGNLPGLSQMNERKNYSRTTDNLRRLLKEQGRGGDAKSLPKTQQRWMPFDQDQQAQMKMAYSEEIDALTRNPDPLITFHKSAAIKVLRRSDTGDRDDLKRQMG